MFQVKHKAKLHNRFDIIVRDVVTGEEQHYEAENILLDRLYSEVICNISANRRVGTQIAFGSGTGTLDATRTNLFTEVGRKTTSVEEVSFGETESYCVKKVVLLPAEYIGESFTEVGLAWTTTGIETHALIEDSEGNPISIGPKTDTQEITIFSTFYVSFSSPGDQLQFDILSPTDESNNSYLLRFLLGLQARNTSSNTNLSDTSTSPNSAGMAFFGSNCKLRKNYNSNRYNSDVLGDSVVNGPWVVVDAQEKRLSTNVARFESSHANGKIWQVVNRVGSSNSDNRSIALRSVFPNTAFSGLSLTDKAIGTGDGTSAGFTLPWDDHVWNSETIKVNGVSQVRGTDYSIKKLGPGEYTYLLAREIEVNDINWDIPRIISLFTTHVYNIPYSAGADPFILFDFGEVAKWFFDIFRINHGNWANRRIGTFTVETSSDKEVWTERAVLTPPATSGHKDLTLGTALDVEYRYLKLKMSNFAHGSEISAGNWSFVNTQEQIIFASPPTNSAPITGDWQVHYVPKDTDYMFDSQFVLEFADGNA